MYNFETHLFINIPYYWTPILFRTSILLNKCLIFLRGLLRRCLHHLFSRLCSSASQRNLLVRYHLGTTPWSTRRTRARLILRVILATGDLIDIFGIHQVSTSCFFPYSLDMGEVDINYEKLLC